MLTPVTTDLRTIFRGAIAARDFALADACAFCRVVRGREGVRAYLMAVGIDRLGLNVTNELLSLFLAPPDLDAYMGDGWVLDLSTGEVSPQALQQANPGML